MLLPVCRLALCKSALLVAVGLISSPLLAYPNILLEYDHLPPADAADGLLKENDLFLQYSHNKAEQQNNETFKAKTQGYTIGWSTSLSGDQSLYTGVFYTLADGDVTAPEDAKIDTKEHITGINTFWFEDDFFFHGQLRYGRGHNNDRNGLCSLSYNTRQRGVRLMAGHSYSIGDSWQWQPLLSFDRFSYKTGHINGAVLPAEHEYSSWYEPINHSYRTKQVGAGIRLLGNLNLFAFRLWPQASVTRFHDFKSTPLNTITNYGVAGSSFLVNGTNKDRNRWQYDISMDVKYQDSGFLTLAYSRHTSDDFKLWGFVAIMRYEF